MSRSREVVRRLESGLRIADEVVAGRHGAVPVRRYRGSSSPAHPQLLIWIHGGAFMSGGLDQLESHAVAAALARHGVEVVAVDYRLVPRCSFLRDAPPGRLPGVRFPVPLEDVVDVCTAVAGDRTDYLLGGASAGAALAASAALRLPAERAQGPAGMVLAYGTFHAELPAPSAELRSRTGGVHSFLQFRPESVRRMNRNYAGTLDALDHPHAFAGGHDLCGLPAALLLDADRDTLRASSEMFADELVGAGVPVARHVVRGARHGFLDRPATGHFSRGIAVIADWLGTRSANLS